jgi:hypothetical protein
MFRVSLGVSAAKKGPNRADGFFVPSCASRAPFLYVLFFCGIFSMTTIAFGDSAAKTAVGSAVGDAAGAAVEKMIGGNTGEVVGRALGK